MRSVTAIITRHHDAFSVRSEIRSPLNVISVSSVNSQRSAMPRLSHDEYYLQMLDLVAARSTCPRRAVGAIIVDSRNRVLSTGYNGPPRGRGHCIDSPCPGRDDAAGDSDRCEAVHSEINALLQCGDIERASTIYVSCSPCFACAKAIANTNIRRVVCRELYRDMRGRDLLLALDIILDIQPRS